VSPSLPFRGRELWPRGRRVTGARPVEPLVRAAVVVLGGGTGTRVGGSVNKIYLPLAGRRVLSWSFTWASQVPAVCRYVLVVRPDEAELAEQTLRREAPGLRVSLVVGGNSRHESEESALAALAAEVESGEIDVIAIHDAARPLAAPSLWRTVIETAAELGGALPVLPTLGVLPDPSARPHPGSGGRLVRVQTPQAFQAKQLLGAFDAARLAGYRGTDTASSVEQHSALAIHAVPGSRFNLKITYPHDLFLAERLLAGAGYRLT
jgi:2-C-methyl-D-erythritol 4-phosphate cytidylyltransferase